MAARESSTSWRSSSAGQTALCGRDCLALLRNGLRAVRSYQARHDLIDGEVVAGMDLESSIERLFEDQRAAYLHIHSATAGCFTRRVDRAA